ncbi:MAG: helix-turn-helix domain-containing protein [Chloroflexi bacterium]|nr:helix-turn-helix domain-containing protein [Chloroflexota bacterium]
MRLSQGISQAELARRLGTSQAAVARLEAGGVDPRLETLQRISRALGAELIVELRPREVQPS